MIKLVKYLVFSWIIFGLIACSSDDDSSGLPDDDFDIGEASMILENYEDQPPILLEGASGFGLEQLANGEYQLSLNMNGEEAKMFNFTLIINLPNDDFQQLEGLTLPIDDVNTYINGNGFGGDLILYGEGGLGDVIGIWTSIESDQLNGSITIDQLNEDTFEGSFQTELGQYDEFEGELIETVSLTEGSFRAIPNF